MKASRAAIRTAKAVKAAEERLTVVERRLTVMDKRLGRIETVLQQLVAAVSADKPSRLEHDQNVPKARTVQKRGGA